MSVGLVSLTFLQVVEATELLLLLLLNCVIVCVCVCGESFWL